MEVFFKKDGIKNYMIIKDENEMINDYRLQMVINNDIEEILPLNIKNINNENQFCYDITAQNSMRSTYSKEKISIREIEIFVISLSNMAKAMKEYLLDINKVILDTNYIYWNERRKTFRFCYYPGNTVSMKEGLVNVFTDMLEMINYKEQMGVVIGYGLQQMVLSENITITELVEFVNQKKEEEISSEYSSDIRKKEEKQTEYDNEEVIEESLHEEIKEHKKKKRWWQFWRKEKPIGQKELLEEGKYNELWDKETIAGDTIELNQIDEEATVLLSSNIQSSGIILRSTDIENPMTIIPNGFPCIIGKSVKSSDCRIDEQFISRVHARIYETMDGYYIEDLNSSNGTFLNGEKIMAHNQKQFNIGDVITLANMEFVVE